MCLDGDPRVDEAWSQIGTALWGEPTPKFAIRPVTLSSFLELARNHATPQRYTIRRCPRISCILIAYNQSLNIAHCSAFAHQTSDQTMLPVQSTSTQTMLSPAHTQLPVLRKTCMTDWGFHRQ